jgi:lipoprotein-anchoring transpeptidase ErfK/SrfK
MKFILMLALSFGLFLSAPVEGTAGILVAKVDVSEQTMRVYKNGKQIYRWRVSTARKGKVTPRGRWSAKWLSRHHKSSLYNNAPMPHSIFFNGNYAIHGTNQVSRLGRPASAGCVRLHPEHARILFNMTQKVGRSNMRVEIKNRSGSLTRGAGGKHVPRQRLGLGLKFAETCRRFIGIFGL